MCVKGSKKNLRINSDQIRKSQKIKQKHKKAREEVESCFKSPQKSFTEALLLEVWRTAGEKKSGA